MTPTSAHRLSELLGCRVVSSRGHVLGVVKDARLAPTAAVTGHRALLTVDGLVVGSRNTGAFLGYDRQDEQGPWLVRTIVQRIHRDSGYLPWDQVREVDWSAGVVQATADTLAPLTRANAMPV
jgi:sporulation protein YlmC with PRC-barrel domain